VRREPASLVLLGHPVEHSLSPVFQNAALIAAGKKQRYTTWDVLPSMLERDIRELGSSGAAGNITIPHKEAAAALMDELTPVATRAGAVNVFWVNDDALLVGDNTDCAARGTQAAVLLGGATQNLKIAVLGAGGAAAAVLVAAEKWLSCDVTLHNRTRSRAEALASRFPCVSKIADSPEDAVAGAMLVINATAVGLRDSSQPAGISALAPGAAVLDLVYRPHQTAWVKAARERGHRAADGLGVLLEQGALSWERWFGEPAPRDIMRRALETSASRVPT
jgi:shikimate dehydrogenase